MAFDAAGYLGCALLAVDAHADGAGVETGKNGLASAADGLEVVLHHHLLLKGEEFADVGRLAEIG